LDTNDVLLAQKGKEELVKQISKIPHQIKMISEEKGKEVMQCELCAGSHTTGVCPPDVEVNFTNNQ
jgi:hypothetical protein